MTTTSITIGALVREKYTPAPRLGKVLAPKRNQAWRGHRIVLWDGADHAVYVHIARLQYGARDYDASRHSALVEATS